MGEGIPGSRADVRTLAQYTANKVVVFSRKQTRRDRSACPVSPRPKRLTASASYCDAQSGRFATLH